MTSDYPILNPTCHSIKRTNSFSYLTTSLIMEFLCRFWFVYVYFHKTWKCFRRFGRVFDISQAQPLRKRKHSWNVWIFLDSQRTFVKRNLVKLNRSFALHSIFQFFVTSLKTNRLGYLSIELKDFLSFDKRKLWFV